MLVELGRRRLEIFFQIAIPSVKSLESLTIVVLQKKLSKWRRKLICVCVSVCVFTSLLLGVADTEGKQGQERCRVQWASQTPFVSLSSFLFASLNLLLLLLQAKTVCFFLVGRRLQMQMMIRLFSSPNMVKSLFLLSTELCTRKAQILVLGRRIDILLKALHSCWILNLLQCNLWTFWKKLSSGSTFYIAMGSEMPACWWSDLVVVTFDYGTDQQQNCFWLICTFFNNQGEWVLILCLCLTGPPKALDEDETEFLDSLEMVSMWYVGASCSFRATLIVGYVALLTCIKDSMLKQPGAILLFCLCCPKIMLWCSSFYTA